MSIVRSILLVIIAGVFMGKALAADKVVYVTLTTNLGDIKLELYPDKAPITVDNFVKYVESGFYDGTVFHRVIPNFMIQGGGFNDKMVQKLTREPIKNEATNGLKNLKGTVAMARTQVVDSATAQFFINVADNAFLNHVAPTASDYGYAVFGKVISGMDIVDKIAGVRTRIYKGMQDVPAEPITIKKATIDLAK